MADQISFPQIPRNVWWGMRAQLRKTPTAKFDVSMIAATLGVQETAARQYLAELAKAGILNEEGKATELALRWRQDETYYEAVSEIASETYPEGLLTIAPIGDSNRQTVTNWFMNQGLGEGSARNKAATFLLVTSPEPGETPTSTSTPKSPPVARTANADRTKSDANSGRTQKKDREPAGAANQQELLPLNVNVQIHISADASTEQIETIFSSMKKYLRND